MGKYRKASKVNITVFEDRIESNETILELRERLKQQRQKSSKLYEDIEDARKKKLAIKDREIQLFQKGIRADSASK